MTFDWEALEKQLHSRIEAEKFVQTLVQQLMEQDRELTAADARFTVFAAIMAREQTESRADQFARFYELMDGRPYGHAN